jgi:acetate---CoA ligase (ADP-forming)
VLVILPPPPLFKAEDVAETVVEAASSQAKPVVVALMGSTLVEKARSVLERAHIPAYPFPERAASALGALAKRGEFLTTETLRHRVSKSSQWLGDSVVSLTPDELLLAYGIETAPLKLACTVEQAIEIAHDLGYPVVMKIASPDVLHKWDAGGVVLNIKDPPSLHIAYTQIMERIREALPGARIDGVHIQQQIRDGQEVILGAVRDPQFGPLMMFGSGGVEVEGLKDVAFGLARLDPAEAEKMIRRTWAGRRLQGFRHIPPADEGAAIDVLIKLSHLILDHESIQEIEINPLRVLKQGAIAVDVRVK